MKMPDVRKGVDAKREDSTRLSAARRPRQLRVVVFWDGGSASHPLPAGAELTVGRADECDIVVADDSVSRRHALVRGGPPPTVADLIVITAIRGSAGTPSARSVDRGTICSMYYFAR